MVRGFNCLFAQTLPSDKEGSNTSMNFYPIPKKEDKEVWRNKAIFIYDLVHYGQKFEDRFKVF